MTARTKRPLACLAGCVALLTASAAALADKRLVPSQHATIQAAINAAQPGDTIIVADGIYTGPGNRDLSILGKAITIRSENGAAACIIDSQGLPGQPHCGFIIMHGETPATVIDGFTIRGGNQFNGAGITISNASPTVRNCVLTGNTCDCWGAAIYVEHNAAPLIEKCLMTGNTSAAEGGGLFVWNASPIVRDCEIVNNAGDIGAGVCAFGGATQLVNCIIAGNGPAFWAGGVYMHGGTVTNCTVVGNTATTHASGIFLQAGAAVRNTIVWGNTGASSVNAPAGTITYSNVEGGFAGTGNISTEPKFASPTDLRLLGGSPCIDAGNSAAAGLPATDMTGNARRIDDPATADTGIGGTPMIDIGAYEFPACPCDIDGGGLAVTDIFAFLGLWFAGDARADFDHDTQVQTPDIFAYLGCWFGACN